MQPSLRVTTKAYQEWGGGVIIKTEGDSALVRWDERVCEEMVFSHKKSWIVKKFLIPCDQRNGNKP